MDTTLPNVRKALLSAGLITKAESDKAPDSLMRIIVSTVSLGGHHAAISAACAIDGARLPPKAKR